MFRYMEEHINAASPALYYNFGHARDLILKKDPGEIARNAQVDFDAENSYFSFLSLNQSIEVSYPECKVVFTETGKGPDIHWQMPILHYLATADGSPLGGEVAAIRDLKRHVAHPELFEHETGEALFKNFDGKNIDRLKEVCATLGGEIIASKADLFVKLAFLPSFPIYIQLWMSEEGIPGSGKMLFDKDCLHYIDEMDIHIIGPLVVNFLIKHYALLSGRS